MNQVGERYWTRIARNRYNKPLKPFYFLITTSGYKRKHERVIISARTKEQAVRLLEDDTRTVVSFQTTNKNFKPINR